MKVLLETEDGRIGLTSHADGFTLVVIKTSDPEARIALPLTPKELAELQKRVNFVEDPFMSENPGNTYPHEEAEITVEEDQFRVQIGGCDWGFTLVSHQPESRAWLVGVVSRQMNDIYHMGLRRGAASVTNAIKDALGL